MSRKKQASKSKRQNSPQQHVLREKKEQRETIDRLCNEIADLHEVSLYVMYEMGILPPLYAGEHLGENREAIALWGVNEESPEIGAMFVRVMPNIEPNEDLQTEREDLGLFNDWPITELLNGLKDSDGKPLIEGAENLKDMQILFALLGNQIQPAPGYYRQGMIEAVARLLPYAVFIHIPVAIEYGEDEEEEVVYNWDDLEHYHAEIIYAESPQLLEVAVWEYRLNLALTSERADLVTEGLDPAEELLATTSDELGALWDMLVMRTVRVYGTTSAIRAKQLELDILREENGDLLIKTPLKRDAEPVAMLAETRLLIEANEDNILLRLEADSPMMRKIWPQVRANAFYAIRLREGVFVTGKHGELKVNGYSDSLTMEWVMTDSLPDLYRQVRLFSLSELLSVGKFIRGKTHPVEHFENSKAEDPLLMPDWNEDDTDSLENAPQVD